MKDFFVDLHLHTNYSDGELTPQQLIIEAQKAGLYAIAITDHDNTDGLCEAIKEGAKRGIEVIPGVELSTELKNSFEEEIHIIGYYINWENNYFQENLSLYRKAREKRAYKMLEKFSKLEINLDEKRVFEIAGKGSIGRPHFAKALQEKEYVKTFQEAFEKYIGFGKPAYVPKYTLKPEEAIKLIIRVGGIPVLAHPYYGGGSKALIKSFMRMGLKGIEVWHAKQSSVMSEKFKQISEELGLIATGGSDCHGNIKEEEPIGKIKVSYTAVLELKKYKNLIDKDNINILK